MKTITTVAFALTLIVVHLFPPGFNDNVCRNDIVLRELDRMDASEQMVFEHIEVDAEIDRELTECTLLLQECNGSMYMRSYVRSHVSR